MRSVAILLVLLSLPTTTWAATGAWSDKAAGGVVSVGKQLLVGRSLHAPSHQIPASARVTRLSWRIQLLSPPPPGLQIKLCGETSCLPLPALAGEIAPSMKLPATGDFHFIYIVNYKGQLTPPLNVVNNTLTLNYR
ncbi:flagellar protein FlhE [Enterobacter pasteurii]|uniref:flagellar protein FlhE n=1 Tax=Enterobacter pasteurii TaxID=3029761 RepID=UPI0011DDAE19|nr:flagellar protein FlhE [Enterobacter pasteurii]QLA68093.1 flagellar protein FlhE [Enterobacter pasteurii]